MIIFFKDPFDYYIENEGRKENKELLLRIVPLVKYSILPITVFLLILAHYLTKK
jgi:hypothetical protein